MDQALALFQLFTDMELAQAIRDGGLDLPPGLETKVNRIQAQQEASEHPDAKPDAAQGEGD